MNDSIEPTWNTIKRFFRGADIAVMRDNSITKPVPLDEMSSVINHGFNISFFVSEDAPVSSRMPPPPYRRWTGDMVSKFNAWYNGSRSEVDTNLQQEAEPFANLSEFLTGYEGLNQDPDLALVYLDRLHTQPGLNGTVDELISMYEDLPEQEFVDEINNNPQFKETAQTIILLWYTGAFFDDNGFTSDFGEKGAGQYIDGLVWRAIQAHPMGYATEASQYWESEPNDQGTFSGLSSTASPPGPQPTPDSPPPSDT